MIRLVHMGLGPIGAEIAGVAAKQGFESVTAIDPNPHLVGRPLSEVSGAPAHSSVRIQAEFDQSHGATVALHSTGSRLEQVAAQILSLIDAGLNVVSTCEELSYPWSAAPTTAQEIDSLARQRGVTVLGTGVNPGYAMDYLPLVLTAPCQDVERIEVHRVQDASTRRLPLQKKVGAGMSPAEFDDLAKRGLIGHVGLLESAFHLAAALGWEPFTAEERIEPRIAEATVVADIGTVQPGQVTGIHQEVEGFVDGRLVVKLTLDMAVGLGGSRDTVKILGQPSIELVIEGGIHGDVATGALVVNSIEGVIGARPGLLTASELPPPRPRLPGGNARDLSGL